MRERRYAPLGVTTDHESRIATLEGAGGGATQLSELSDVNTSTATNGNASKSSTFTIEIDDGTTLQDSASYTLQANVNDFA